MTYTPVALRYARALFEYAREQHRLDAVLADLQELGRRLLDSPEVERLTRPLGLTPTERALAWRHILEGRADPLTLRFILFLIDKGRIAALHAIIDAFEHMVCESRGIEPIEIIAAQPLDEARTQQIADRFARRLGRRIQPTVSVNPALLGGFQVRVRDTIYDYSLTHQLDNLHRAMLTA